MPFKSEVAHFPDRRRYWREEEEQQLVNAMEVKLSSCSDGSGRWLAARWALVLKGLAGGYKAWKAEESLGRNRMCSSTTYLSHLRA